MSKNLMETSELNYDNMLVGNFHTVMDKVVVKAGSAYKRGTVLGLINAEGKATVVNSTKEDGSGKPYGILADDVDATDADCDATVYLTGEFNEDKLIFGGTDKVETHKRVLREMGIFLRKTMK